MAAGERLRSARVRQFGLAFAGEVRYLVVTRCQESAPQSRDEIPTAREVAALLKIGGKTACTMARAGQLPGIKVRGQWRFRRTDTDRWIARQVGRGAESDQEGESR